MTKFKLTRVVLGKQPQVQLTREEYDAILEAKRGCIEGLAMEDLFNLMLGNYEEFERELLSITLRNATYFGAYEWNDVIDTIQLVARRFANLLTTTHGYCDQVPHSISSLYGKNSQQVEEVRAYFRHEHSSGFSYRACTELRKYMQHRGSAVHGSSSYCGRAERPNGKGVNVYSFVPAASLAKLREDPKFKRSVLAEMEKEIQKVSMRHDEDWIDLRPIVREYVSALGRIHLKVREMIVPKMGQCDGTISAAVDRFRALPDADSVLGLAAVEVNERGLNEGRRPAFVSTKPTELRRQLEQLNRHPTHFHTNVVTGEVDPPRS